MTSYFEARRVSPPNPDAVSIHPFLRSVLPASRSAKILDIGCGYGGTMLALQKAGYSNLRGIDIDDGAVAMCRTRNLSVEKVDITAIDFDQYRDFDLILMSHVLEHMPKDRMIEIVSRIRDALKPGGCFLLVVPNAQSATGSYWAFEDFTHTFLFTSGSVYYVGRMAGFEDIRFIDIDCTMGNDPVTAFLRRLLLRIYVANRTFWNKVTRSTWHNESVPIYSFEIKALMRKT